MITKRFGRIAHCHMSSTRKKAKTSEGTAKEGTDSAQELMVEESKELLEEVRVMNEKQISEGKYMLNVMIPDKISQIDSYIKEGDRMRTYS